MGVRKHIRLHKENSNTRTINVKNIKYCSKIISTTQYFHLLLLKLYLSLPCATVKKKEYDELRTEQTNNKKHTYTHTHSEKEKEIERNRLHFI